MRCQRWTSLFGWHADVTEAILNPSLVHVHQRYSSLQPWPRHGLLLEELQSTAAPRPSFALLAYAVLLKCGQGVTRWRFAARLSVMILVLESIRVARRWLRHTSSSPSSWWSDLTTPEQHQAEVASLLCFWQKQSFLCNMSTYMKDNCKINLTPLYCSHPMRQWHWGWLQFNSYNAWLWQGWIQPGFSEGDSMVDGSTDIPV